MSYRRRWSWPRRRNESTEETDSRSATAHSLFSCKLLFRRQCPSSRFQVLRSTQTNLQGNEDEEENINKHKANTLRLGTLPSHP